MKRKPFKARADAPRGDRMRLHAFFLVAFAAFVSGDAPAQFSIDAHVIASGGGRTGSAGGCYALAATFGEPVGGRAAGGAFALEAGFQAGPGRVRGDRMFRGDFEECV